ncbi:MAG TPA: DUF721 domain-containing protein [Chitinophagaceae bacterium]|nr:DUF721 domain-containing protein [Chitinophagaceae bacterium]
MGEYSLQDAIRQFLDKSQLKGSLQALQIEEIWESVMGKTVARYTDRIQLFGSRLVITTQVAPLKSELIYQREKIRQRVNEALGEQVVREVIVQ